MKPWRETISFAQPVREIQWIGSISVQAEFERLLREREQTGYDRGRLEGEKALSEQLIRQRGEVIELQNGVLDSLRQVVPQVVREVENLLVDLAVDTAQKLVTDLPVSVEMVEKAVRQALEEVTESTDYQVLLQADDLALLQQVNSALLGRGEGSQRIQFEASAEVTRGGCIVQTRFGTVDARRETKIRLLKNALRR